MKFRKKPIEVDSFKWLHDEVPTWWSERNDIHIEIHTATALIPTLEGIMRASPGDWIIKGIKGEVYPCKPEIFEATYEKVIE
jgi:hypothetical protein